MTELPDLSALIAIVDRRGADRSTLERITVAEELTADLRALSDRLVGYYVELARAEGHSWSDIGEHLGVSRQAAQQRYTPRWASLTIADLTQAGAFTRLTRRAHNVLLGSEKQTRRRRHDSVTAEHLLLAILDDEDSLAVKALLALDADPAALRTDVEALVPPGSADSPAAVPVSPTARRALDASFKEALELGHNYIGTEHMLLGLLHDPAQPLTDAGVTRDAARTTIQEILNGYLRRKA